jgi:FkbH-like protein
MGETTTTGWFIIGWRLPYVLQHGLSGMAKTEAVRLVIWDLDETFWHGTLTEGGCQLREDTCALVKLLASRGIISAICSKNNHDDVKPILENAGVWEYFVFPSINWEPKGPRIAALVEIMQLRPATVMFIDDNPLNREEVRHHVPGIQVENENIILMMADHPLFIGKADAELSRLKQYKLLETRKRDENTFGADTSDFLRTSNIRVHVEIDVESNIDRAIELINRTNQLNFTKNRLPEDAFEAAATLRRQMAVHNAIAGLVRVVDRYGDYGYVGFYLLHFGRNDHVSGDAPQTLVHYCFSCRTLGMHVEQWLYRWLRRPALTVVGEVVSDLFDRREIDWVKFSDTTESGGSISALVAPEIRAYGGCEIHPITHYLASRAQSIRTIGNMVLNSNLVQLNSVYFICSALDRRTEDFKTECSILKLPYHDMAFDFFADAPVGTLFVFGFGYDEHAWHQHYQHKQHGWRLKITPSTLPDLNYIKDSEEHVLEQIRSRKFASEDERVIIEVFRHIRANYDSVPRGSDEYLHTLMPSFFDSIPIGCKVILMLNEPDVPSDGRFTTRKWVVNYNRTITEIAMSYPFVEVVNFRDLIVDKSENEGWGHYGRAVYGRAADEIAIIAKRLQGKTCVC